MANYKEVPADFIEEKRQIFNLLLITATLIEKQVLHKHLLPINGETEIIKIQKQQHTYFLGRLGQYNAVHVATGNMGSINRNAAIPTTIDAIQLWQPKVVLMVGISFGAYPDKVRIGDVLVSERVVNYESARVSKDDSIIRRPQEGPASSLLLDRFRSVDGWMHMLKVGRKSYKAKQIDGLMLSGEKLIDNLKLKNELLQEWPHAIGGEMEGAGIYTACESRADHWILVKGVCDFGDGNKSKNKQLYQEIAIESAISLCEKVFSSRYSFDDIDLFRGTSLAVVDKAKMGNTPAELTLKEDPARFLVTPTITKNYIPTQPTPYLVHPYAIIKNFTGRREEFEALDNWAFKKEESVFVIDAIGGMGKTALS